MGGQPKCTEILHCPLWGNYSYFDIEMVIISLYLNPIMCNFILFICDICVLIVTLILRLIGVCAFGFLGF